MSEASVAVQVTVVSPSGNTSGASFVIFGVASTVSVAVASPKLTKDEDNSYPLIDIDVSDGNVQTVTVGGNCEFNFINWPATGTAGTFTLIITNGGAHDTTWHSSVYWPGNNAPALTSSGVDIVSFMTIDAGTTVYGFVGGINFENS